MLKRLCWFQETFPLNRESQLPATLCVFVQQTSIKQGDSMPKSSCEAKMRLWSAVLPWETARGLSGAPPHALVADPLLAFIDGQQTTANGQQSATVPKPSTSEIAESGEIGMLFLHSNSIASSALKSPPPSFWSGAITTPIDIGFIQRTDPYAGVRSNIRQALGRLVGLDDPKFGVDTLRAEGMELVIADCGKLEPFETCDRVNGTPLAQLYPDLYGKGGALPNSKRTTEVTSRAHNISLVLETRRGMLRDHVTRAVSSAPRVATDNSQANVVMMLKLSDELHDEIEEKRQLLKTMVASLEDSVKSDIARSGRAHKKDDDSGSEATSESDETSAEDPRPVVHHRSRDPDARSKDDDVANDPRLTPTLVGKQSTSSLATSDDGASSTTSARRASRYPQSDPSMMHLSKLNYPVLVMAFKLCLCVQEIMALGPRMIDELQRGVVDRENISWLLHFVDDPSLSLPDELTNAIRVAARALGVQERAPLDCDWAQKADDATLTHKL
jgi:hypothetical protein